MTKILFFASALIILSYNLAQAGNSHAFLFRESGKSHIEITAEKGKEKLTLLMTGDGSTMQIAERNAKKDDNGVELKNEDIIYGTVSVNDLGRLVQLASIQDNDQRDLVEEILIAIKLNKETPALDAAANATTYDALSTIIERLNTGLALMEHADAKIEIKK
jgi:hypothetical protein